MLGALMLTLERGAYGINPRLAMFTQILSVPLLITMIGIACDAFWSRWLALAGAIAVLPWALVLTFGVPAGAPLVQQSVALIAALMLLASLTGRAMFERYEGKGSLNWRGPRLSLVRWTIILNAASVLGLSLFVALYRYAIEWHATIPGILLLSLVTGVVLLARQKTAGLVAVALSCALFVPAGAYFVWREARTTGEVYVFAAAFVPGIIAGWACLVVFGRPIWRVLRPGSEPPA